MENYELDSVQEAPPEIIEQKLPPGPEPELDMGLPEEPELEPVVPVVKKQRRRRLQEEQQKVADLTVKVASLQEQLDKVSEIRERQLLAKTDAEVDLQGKSESESVLSALTEQQSEKLEEQQKVVELTVKAASLQEKLDAASSIMTQQYSSESSSEVGLQGELASEVEVSTLNEQQGKRLEQEQQKVAELTVRVATLQKELSAASSIITQQSLDGPEPAPGVDVQTEQVSESVVSALNEQHRIRLEEEQHKVAELSTQVASLQVELNTASAQANAISSTPVQVSESVPVGANHKVKRIIEALLFAAEQPMTVKRLQAVFPELEAPKKQEIQDAIDALCFDYKEQGIVLHKVASGYRFQVNVDMAPWVARLFAEKPPKYSRALLETIAIIAYQQPVTRGDIEEIRGVSVSSNMIRTLLEREWIIILAHKEAPGRPALYGTTKQFLDYFNLESLEDMPPLEELHALALEGELEV